MRQETLERFAFGLLRPQAVIFWLTLINLFWFSWPPTGHSSEPVFRAIILSFSAFWLLFSGRGFRVAAFLLGAMNVSVFVFADYYLSVKYAESVMLSLDSIEAWLLVNLKEFFPIALAISIFLCAAISFASCVRDSASRAELKTAALSFTRRVLTNRAGQFLFVAHLVAVAHEFANSVSYKWDEDYFYRGNYWWFDSFANWNLYNRLDQSTLFETLRLLDIPSLLFSTMLTPLRILIYPHISLQTVSWLETPIILAITAAQWFLVGYALAGLWRWMRKLVSEYN